MMGGINAEGKVHSIMIGKYMYTYLIYEGFIPKLSSKLFGLSSVSHMHGWMKFVL